MIDISKIGEAAAKAMDYIEKIPSPDQEEFTLSEVMVVVVLDKPFPIESDSDRMETLCYAGCTNERIYVKEGILRFALDVIQNPDDVYDEE